MKKKTKRFILCSCILIILGIMLYGGLYLYASFTPKLPIKSANSFYLYDINNNLYETESSSKWVSLDEISPHLINATIAIEDKNFFKHWGFDYLRILKALYINFKNRKTLQGASTITQQYAKNLFLDFDKNWSRKLEEAWLTIRLETQYSKEDILEGYLNTINYGGIFGIENASWFYFGKSAKELNLAESAILAGIPKSPSNYSPLTNKENSKKRQSLILDAMEKEKFISANEKEEAKKMELTFLGVSNKNNSKMLMYYEDAVLEELKSIDTIPNSFLQTGGLKIYTNFDINAQNALENSINTNITNPDIEIAGVVMDPNTGKILALTGGMDYSKSQFNRAIKSKRQVGSTMKPLLYYAALENGFTPSSSFTSEKTTFTFSGDKTYSPSNYANKYPNKEVSMTYAIAHSDNIFAVKTHLFLGEETLVDMAKRLGIETPLAALPSLALGSEEINLMEMMGAYGKFASGGYNVEPYFINKVEDANGNVLYEHKSTKNLVLNTNLTFILNELLTNTYARELVDDAYPTCYNISYKMKRKYAVKTGTTDTDLLIFGYNPELLIGLWSGYDDNREVIPTDSAALKNTWVDAMESYLGDKEEVWYKMPDNIVGVLVDPITGKVATNDTVNKRMLYYLKGTEPSVDYSLDSLIPTMKEE